MKNKIILIITILVSAASFTACSVTSDNTIDSELSALDSELSALDSELSALKERSGIKETEEITDAEDEACDLALEAVESRFARGSVTRGNVSIKEKYYEIIDDCKYSCRSYPETGYYGVDVEGVCKGCTSDGIRVEVYNFKAECSVNPDTGEASCFTIILESENMN